LRKILKVNNGSPSGLKTEMAKQLFGIVSQGQFSSLLKCR
jgi:hypothetical protein